MTGPFMTAIVILGVPGKLFSHDGRYTVLAAFKEQMNVIGHEDPCIHLRLSLDDILRKPFEKTSFVTIVVKDRGFVYPSDDDVVQCSRYVEAGFARHDAILCEEGTVVKRKASIETTSL